MNYVISDGSTKDILAGDIIEIPDHLLDIQNQVITAAIVVDVSQSMILSAMVCDVVSRLPIAKITFSASWILNVWRPV
jgi:hypothetical protein